MKIQFGKTTGIILGIALAVVIWIAGILIGQEQAITMLDPENGLRGFFNQNRAIKVSLMLDYGDGRIEVYPGITINYGGSALKLLKKVEANPSNQLNLKYNENSQTGEISSISINGYSSSESGKQWQVWLNINLQTIDLSKIKLRAKDVVEFKYIKLRQE